MVILNLPNHTNFSKNICLTNPSDFHLYENIPVLISDMKDIEIFDVINNAGL